MLDLTKDTVDILLQLVTAGGGGGVQPTGEITILENGQYDVSEFASAYVQVSGGKDFLGAYLSGETVDVYENDDLEKMNVVFEYSKFKALRFPNLTQISNSTAFAQNNILEEFWAPKLESISDYAFVGASKLSSFCFDSVKSIGNNAFGSTALAGRVELPVLTTIVYSPFCYCDGVTQFSAPKLVHQTLTSPPITNAAHLTTLDIGAVDTINNRALFVGEMAAPRNSDLKVVTLRKSDGISAAAGTSIFASSSSGGNTSPISQGNGYILVPRSLISSYETATNWSYFKGLGVQFLAVEDYTLDGTITGLLDWDKIAALEAA